MKDHYPTTAEEFNFQAELKAASHWCWPDKGQLSLSLKSGPHNDCRVRIAAQKTCQKWLKEVEISDLSQEDDERISGELKSNQYVQVTKPMVGGIKAKHKLSEKNRLKVLGRPQNLLA